MESKIGFDIDQKKCNVCNMWFKRTTHITKHVTTRKHIKHIEEYAEKQKALLIELEKKNEEIKRKKNELKQQLKQQLAEKNKEIANLQNKLGQAEAEHIDLMFILKNKIGGRALEQNIAKRAGLMNFDDIDYETFAECKQDWLKSNLGLGLEGDLAIIKELYINNFEGDTIPIKLADYSRKKFKIRQNGIFVSVNARRIIMEYIKRITPIFSQIIRQYDRDYYNLTQKNKNNTKGFELVLDEAVFDELWKQKKVHFLNLCTDKYLKELINGLTSLFSESTQ